VTDRTPHNLEAEQALLGAILLNNDAYGFAIKHVDAADFYVPLHAQIFQESGRLISLGRRVNTVTLKDAFPAGMAAGDDITISQYLARLAAEATTVVNAPDYARVIRDLALAREIIGIGADLERAPNLGFNADEAIRRAFEQLDTLRANFQAGDDDRATMESLAHSLSARMASDQREEAAHAVSTGFQDLDRQLGGGYRDGRLFVWAGRPGAGKTVYMVASARRVAKAGFGALLFSLEMPRDDIMARFAASELAHTETPLDYRDVLVNDLDPFQRQRVIAAADRLQELPIHVDCTAGLGIFEMTARARLACDRWRRQGIKPGLIGIDYLGLVRTGDRYRGNKVDELGEIAKQAKILAGQLEVPVLLLAQLNRGVEGRDDKRPVMADLRASGEIEEHADVVGLLYRPFYYTQRDPRYRDRDPAAMVEIEKRKHDLDVGLDKNRLGPTTVVHLWCDVAKSAVDNSRHY